MKKCLNDELLKLNIQFFSEGEEIETDEAEDVEGTPQNDEAEQPEENEDDKPIFTKKQFDDRLSRERARLKKEKDEAVTEAEKLAKMNKEQRDEYQRQQDELERQELKDKLARYEMRDTASQMLSDRGLPVNGELLDALVTADAEETKTKIDIFAKVVETTVQAKIKDLVNTGEPQNRPGRNRMTKAEIMKVKDPNERAKLIDQHRNLFN